MILYFVYSEHVVRLRQLSIRVAFNTVRYSSSPLPLVSVHTPLTSVLKRRLAAPHCFRNLYPRNSP
jgi:hypothetical protein